MHSLLYVGVSVMDSKDDAVWTERQQVSHVRS